MRKMTRMIWKSQDQFEILKGNPEGEIRDDDRESSGTFLYYTPTHVCSFSDDKSTHEYHT